MKKASLWILVIISISCLLLLAFIPQVYSADGFILPAFFSFIVFLIILTWIPPFSNLELPTQPHVVYQLRAPPFPLF